MGWGGGAYIKAAILEQKLSCELTKVSKVRAFGVKYKRNSGHSGCELNLITLDKGLVHNCLFTLWMLVCILNSFFFFFFLSKLIVHCFLLDPSNIA